MKNAVETRKNRADLGSTVSASNAILALRYLELCVRAGQPERALGVAEGLLEQIQNLRTGNLLRLLRAALDIGHVRLAISTIEHLANQDTLSEDIALHLVLLAHASGAGNLAERLVSRLPRSFPNLEQTGFSTEAAMLLSGPDTALRQIRLNRRQSRGVRDVARLARVLLAAGEAPLAYRYLQRAQKKWPNAKQLRNLLITACLNSGRLAEGWAYLREWDANAADFDLFDLRVRFLLETGELESAYEILRSQRAQINHRENTLRYFQICLALARLEDAKEAVTEVVSHLGRKSMSQFKITHLGSLLNELELFRRLVESSEQDSLNDMRGFAEDYFFPAKTYLDRWLAGVTPSASSDQNEPSDIPRRIVQYWDTQDVPKAISETMKTWQKVKGYEYNRLDQRGAVEFLRARFDANHARAFRLANHVAEAADFLRLCMLLADGGIYADADDKLMGDPEQIRNLGSGMVLFREPIGAIVNNLICARPGHKLLQLAVDMSRAALLRRDNDNTWSKTGPGLLTRATAVYLSQVPTDEATRDLTIVSQLRMRPTVHPHLAVPHKRTASYWNARVNDSPASILAALEKIADLKPRGYSAVSN